jgi:hypothetical protein
VLGKAWRGGCGRAHTVRGVRACLVRRRACVIRRKPRPRLWASHSRFDRVKRQPQAFGPRPIRQILGILPRALDPGAHLAIVPLRTRHTTHTHALSPHRGQSQPWGGGSNRGHARSPPILAPQTCCAHGRSESDRNMSAPRSHLRFGAFGPGGAGRRTSPSARRPRPANEWSRTHVRHSGLARRAALYVASPCARRLTARGELKGARSFGSRSRTGPPPPCNLWSWLLRPPLHVCVAAPVAEMLEPPIGRHAGVVPHEANLATYASVQKARG